MYDAATVTRIAMDCGFSSSSSFVRAFRRATGCTASQYRRNRERRRPVGAAAHIPRYPPDPAADALFSAVTLPDLHVAGIACKGLSKHFRGADNERAFHRLFAWLADKRTPDGRTPVVGITLDTPEVVSFAECRYFACVPVGEGVRSEGCVSVRTFPTAGPYLQFSLDRNRPDFPEAFFRLTDYLYGHYMPEAGCYPDNRPFVEFYARENDTVVIRFCVPVRWQEMKRKERRAGVSSR
jgi:AraC family transcriptional regulator